MVKIGNPNSVTDAAVGALCIRTAIYGAYLNVKINASGLKDKVLSAKFIDEANDILEKAKAEETEILRLTEEKM